METSTIADTSGHKVLSEWTLHIGSAASIFLALVYIAAVWYLVKANTRRWLFLTAYATVLIGSIGGWIGFHGNILEAHKQGVCVGVVMIICFFLFFLGVLPFNILLLKSQLQLVKSRKPHLFTHLLAFTISTAFTGLLIFQFAPGTRAYFDIPVAIISGYTTIVGARLLYSAVTSTSLSIVKEKKVVGKLVRKEDSTWVEVENELEENVEKSGFC